MVDREVDVPVWVVLGRSCGLSWGLCWRSWAALGAYVGGLGASWNLSGRSWAEAVGLGASVGGPGGSKAAKWPKPSHAPRSPPKPRSEAHGENVKVDDVLDISPTFPGHFPGHFLEFSASLGTIRNELTVQV